MVVKPWYVKKSDCFVRKKNQIISYVKKTGRLLLSSPYPYAAPMPKPCRRRSLCPYDFPRQTCRKRRSCPDDFPRQMIAL
jgi:hypothetical protein